MRLHPNSGSVDLRAPFSRRRVRLVEPEEEEEGGERKEEGDWYGTVCVCVYGGLHSMFYPICVSL